MTDKNKKGLHVKNGDRVIVIAGKDKGKIGNVKKVDTEKGKVIVEGVNIIKKHTKGNAQQAGGIVTKEAALDVSNVMYLYKGKPVRIGYTVEVVDGKNVKKRVARPSGDLID